jgi:hypothetical protein
MTHFTYCPKYPTLLGASTALKAESPHTGLAPWTSVWHRKYLVPVSAGSFCGFILQLSGGQLLCAGTLPGVGLGR